MIAKSVASSVARSVASSVGVSAGGGQAGALTANYVARVAAAGNTLDATSQSAIRSIFSAVESNGGTISNGWLFGSKLNANNKNLQLNLIEGKPSIVPAATYHATTALSDAMLGIRNNGSATHAAKTSDNTGFLDNAANYNVLWFGTYAGDSQGSSQQTSPNIFTQGESSVAGHIQMFGSTSGGTQWIDRPSSVTGMGGASGGGTATLREANIDPIAMWIEYTPTQFRTLHPEGSAEGYLTRNGNPTANPFLLGNATAVGDVSHCFILKIEGALTNTQRANIWSAVYAAWRKVGRAALLVGNSVSIPGVTEPMLAYAKQLQRWGCYNNTVFVRRAGGTLRLPAFCPTGYTQPAGAPTDSSIATRTVNILDWFAPNVLIDDEQQNYAGFMSSYADRWPAFLHAHNAIVSRFNAMQDSGRMRAVICTQIAWPNYPIPGSFLDTPLTYAQVAGRAFMRDMSILTRAASQSDYNNVKTTVADWYAYSNEGWPIGDDGTALDPINDLPKGDLAKFIDPQHPNQTGQDGAFTMWRDAITAAYAL